MPATHRHSTSVSQNQKAQLANAYNELGKELSSSKIRVVGNYTLGKVIGEGAYGKVRMGTHRLTSTRVAIKQIPKAMSASLTREIHHHRQLHHPNITQMYEVIATESSIWIVTELCCGGELYDYLAEKGSLTEDETKIMFGQLCLAVAYLHEKGIVHRDLKLENVLLDEKCRVKLGDFGFTREFDSNILLETFCGTTGYASPEMLQGRKYYGPEVDVWSLGIILYCLLTGTLPFDDDDEAVMRKKIIRGDYEDPEWLSPESRDLIKNILVQDTSKRLTIAKILAHPWFTTSSKSESDPLTSALPLTSVQEHSSSRTSTPDLESHRTSEVSTSSESAAAATSYPVSRGGLVTPDDDTHPLQAGLGITTSLDDDMDREFPAIHSNTSEITINSPDIESLQYKMDVRKHKSGRPKPVLEEDAHTHAQMGKDKPLPPSPYPNGSFSSNTSSSNPRAPPNHPRTPARTKRRSVSSNLSDPGSPTTSKPGSILPSPSTGPSPAPLDFSSLLNTPAPMIFTTPLERQLLNTLSDIGYDTGQIVHSVLTNACDAAGAVWWMLKKKADAKKEQEKPTAVEDQEKTPVPGASSGSKREREKEKDRGHRHHRDHHHRKTVNASVQTDAQASGTLFINSAIATAINAGGKLTYYPSAPQLAFLPATPTIPRPMTPPSSERSRSPMLSPTPATTSSKSNPTTPSGSLNSTHSKTGGGRKNRSGSVSIMQRATTALEAAGLVKKKSAETIRDSVHKVEDTSKDSKDSGDRRSTMSGEDVNTRNSISLSSATGKSTKSPKLKPYDEHGGRVTPSTPPPLPPSGTTSSELLHHPQPQMGSPWVAVHPPQQDMRGRGHGISPPTPANSPGEFHLDSSGSAGKSATTQRNRANILNAFKFWFNEDKKGKRKEASQGPVRPAMTNVASSSSGGGKSTVKRRMSGNGSKAVGGTSGKRTAKRHSASSRRSSSINSRRSSIGSSAQVLVLDPHYMSTTGATYDPKRNVGNHTPCSERGEYSSRPSSIRSFSMTAPGQPRHHRKSPSASSIASSNMRTASPLPKQYHRRGGSGSSTTTRVVRQIVPSSSTGTTGQRSSHGRTNSTASSVHSPASSRPASYYDYGDDSSDQNITVTASNPRTVSPFKPSSSSRRSSLDDPSPGGTSSNGASTHRRNTYAGNTTFVAQKRQGPFTSPISGYNGSIGRTSWKKSWGLEPPGWQTRSTHLPIEILCVSPASEPPGGIRDVFSGRRGSINLGQINGTAATVATAGDEDDWVDEDDDVYPFLGGLGQLGSGANISGSSGSSSNTGYSMPLPPGRHHAPNSNEKHGVTLSAAPRGHNRSKRSDKSDSNSSSGGGKSRSGRMSPSTANGGGSGSGDGGRDPSPDGSNSRGGGGRRQLPSGRAGPTFKHAIAIQEEDEEEEEEE